jgi:hypothetical protein
MTIGREDDGAKSPKKRHLTPTTSFVMGWKMPSDEDAMSADPQFNSAEKPTLIFGIFGKAYRQSEGTRKACAKLDWLFAFIIFGAYISAVVTAITALTLVDLLIAAILLRGMLCKIVLLFTKDPVIPMSFSERVTFALNLPAVRIMLGGIAYLPIVAGVAFLGILVVIVADGVFSFDRLEVVGAFFAIFVAFLGLHFWASGEIRKRQRRDD